MNPRRRAFQATVLLTLAALLLASLLFLRARSNGVTQLQVLGYTNVNGLACFIVREPYPLQGKAIRSKLIPKALQPVVLYAESHMECHSFDPDGHPTKEVLVASLSYATDLPKGKQTLLPPDTTNRWQYSIQHTQSLRIANKHILDLCRGTLVTTMQEPTLPKAPLAAAKPR